MNTLENVEFAWKHLKTRRIGHGIALRADENLEKTVKEMQLQSEQNGRKIPVTIEVSLMP